MDKRFVQLRAKWKRVGVLLRDELQRGFLPRWIDHCAVSFTKNCDICDVGDHLDTQQTGVIKKSPAGYERHQLWSTSQFNVASRRLVLRTFSVLLLLYLYSLFVAHKHLGTGELMYGRWVEALIT